MKIMTPPTSLHWLHALGVAIALSVSGLPALAQEMDHSKMKMPPAATTPAKKPPAKKTVVKQPVTKKPAAKKSQAPAPAKPAVDPHAGHIMSPATPAAAKKPVTKKPATKKAAAKSKSSPAKPVPAPKSTEEPMDHAAMGHAPAGQEPEKPVDHSAMGHEMPMPQEPAPIDHAAMGHDMPMPSTEPRTPIPAVTEADRIAAFPDVAGHSVHDNQVHSYWLLDRLEAWNAEEGTGIGWEALSWIGTDTDRIWLRSEGEGVDGDIESADIEVLYGRSVAPWWDLVAGVRHDFGVGPSQTFAAVGVQGLAPYKFEVEATAYVGSSGQTAARIEAEYDTLLTNRLILQWQVETELYGRDDARRGIGSGLSTFEAGLRLRYEFSRKFAPYIGIVHERAFGGTADYRRDQFDDVNDTRLVAGLRIWF